MKAPKLAFFGQNVELELYYGLNDNCSIFRAAVFHSLKAIKTATDFVLDFSDHQPKI